MDLDRQREWDEAVRLYYYNQENELLLHGKLINDGAFPEVNIGRLYPPLLVSIQRGKNGSYFRDDQPPQS